MPSDDGVEDVVLRQATVRDVEEVSDLYLRVRAAAVPTMPAQLHTADEVRLHVAGNLSRKEVWVAELDSGVGSDLVAFAEFDRTWLDSLYVAPEHQRAGVGTALLELVKSRVPTGFALWVFESNRPARDFYARHGLVELDHTDGDSNEEHAPDLRMAWLGCDPPTYLTAELAVVDRTLRDLHEHRQALLSRLAGLPGGAREATTPGGRALRPER